jgi:hypothetical protein
MTTQEKINDLAMAALREEPPEKPSPVQLGTSSPALVNHEKPLPVSGSVAAMASEPPAGREIGNDLREVIDFRQAKIKRKRARTRLLVNFCLLSMVAGAASWVTLVPTGRQQLNTLVTAIRESKGDLKSLAGILGVYDKELAKVAVQSARVDAATRALGVDPTKEVTGSNLDLNAEMKRMAGGDAGGPTSLERDQKVQEKYGIVSKLAGYDPNKAKAAAQSDVKF